MTELSDFTRIVHNPAMRAKDAKISRLERVRSLARVISDALHLSPGGDAFEFTGSTNDVDDLRDALQEADFPSSPNCDSENGDG